MLLGFHIASLMVKNKRSKAHKKDIEAARKKDPENVDWDLCVQTVSSLQEWIEELCIENHNLKKTLREVITRIQKDNEATKKILAGINLPDLDSTDTQDH